MKLRDWVHPVLYCFEISITRLVQITFFCVCLSLSHDKYHKKERFDFQVLVIHYYHETTGYTCQKKYLILKI